MNTRNRIRNLSEVVTLEAWHEAAGTGRADLCVNVAFAAGRIGGGGRVRFRLLLKQAEVVVVIPPGEPAKVDVRSVRRDGRKQSAVATETRREGREAVMDACAALGVGAAGADARLRLEAGGRASGSVDRVMELTEALSAMVVEHGQDDDGNHRWRLTPALGDHLLGRVWEDDQRVRLTVVDTRRDHLDRLPPSVRVEIRCRREDLEISDIVLSDAPDRLTFRPRALQRNREIAAEAYLKTRLFEEGLLQGEEADLSDPFALMTLAVVTAEEA